MHASRLVSVILLLQARGQMTAGQLAAELEVSVRTIYRDVGSLQAAGIPLYGDAGPAGGYQLVGGYRTRLRSSSPPNCGPGYRPSPAAWPQSTQHTSRAKQAPRIT
jgi:predicted DNA-binding transcriptional regulator YafY